MAVRAFRFLKASHALDTLEKQEIKVSRFDDLNDPFELYGMDLSNRNHRKRFREFKRWVSQRMGLLCFSRQWHNPLLWSHYGDRHRGVALEFDLDDDLVEEVKYSPYRLRMNVEKALARGYFTEQEATLTASTKAAHWKYEDEVRILREVTLCKRRGELLFEPLNPQIQIVGLVLGPLCKLTKADVQRTLSNNCEIKITWTRLAFTSFNVVRNQAKKPQTVTGNGKQSQADE